MAEFKIQYFHITLASDIEIPDAVSVCLQSHCCCYCPGLSFNIAHNMHKVEKPKEVVRGRCGCKIKKSEQGK